MVHDKYSTWDREIWHLKKWSLKNIAHLAKKCPEIICQGLSWVVFKRKFLNLLYAPDLWSWDFKVEFFPLPSDVPITLLCLIVGAGPISRVLILLQKVNNVVVRCHFCEMPFMLCAIFARWYFWKDELPFCNTVSMGAINVRCLWPFWPSASVRYFRLRYLAMSCSVICRTPIYRTCLGRRLLEAYI